MSDSNESPRGGGQSVAVPINMQRRWRGMLKKYDGNRAALEIADLAIREVQALFTKMQIPRDDILATTRVLLLIRLASSVEALCLLAPFGFITEARVIHRSALDALVKLSGLCRSENHLYEFLARDSRDVLRGLCDLQQLRQRWGTAEDSPTDGEISALMDQAKAELSQLEKEAGRKLKEVKEWEWAKIGQTQEMYWAHYGLYSQAVHHSPRDLNRHIVKDEHGVAGLRYGPESEPIERLILDAVMALLVGVSSFCVATDMKVPDALVDIDEAVKAMHARLFVHQAAGLDSAPKNEV